MSVAIADNPEAVAKRKPPKTSPPPSSPREGQTALMAYIETAISDAFDAWIASMEPKPSKKAVIESILKKALTEAGRWPPKSK